MYNILVRRSSFAGRTPLLEKNGVRMGALINVDFALGGGVRYTHSLLCCTIRLSTALRSQLTCTQR